jgi:hypothetical protein
LPGTHIHHFFISFLISKVSSCIYL